MTPSTQIQTSPPEYRTLPLELRKYKFHHRQVRRSDGAAVYSQSKYGKILACEVIRIRRAKGSLFRGKWIPSREEYPGKTGWGTSGWTVKTLEAAMVKFASVCAGSSQTAEAVSQEGAQLPAVRPEEARKAASTNEKKAPHIIASASQVGANEVPTTETTAPLVAVPQKTQPTRSRTKQIQQDFLQQLMA